MLRELEQYQNEKRKALTNHESNKIKAAEERYSLELKEWRATLGARKLVSAQLAGSVVVIWGGVPFYKAKKYIIGFTGGGGFHKPKYV